MSKKTKRQKVLVPQRSGTPVQETHQRDPDFAGPPAKPDLDSIIRQVRQERALAAPVAPPPTPVVPSTPPATSPAPSPTLLSRVERFTEQWAAASGAYEAWAEAWVESITVQKMVDVADFQHLTYHSPEAREADQREHAERSDEPEGVAMVPFTPPTILRIEIPGRDAILRSTDGWTGLVKHPVLFPEGALITWHDKHGVVEALRASGSAEERIEAVHAINGDLYPNVWIPSAVVAEDGTGRVLYDPQAYQDQLPAPVQQLLASERAFTEQFGDSQESRQQLADLMRQRVEARADYLIHHRRDLPQPRAYRDLVDYAITTNNGVVKVNEALELLTAEEVGDYALTHHLWGKLVELADDGTRDGRITLSSPDGWSDDWRKPQSVQPFHRVFVLSPDGHVETVNLVKWYGPSQLGAQSGIPVVGMRTATSADHQRDEIYDPLVVVLGVDGLLWYRPMLESAPTMGGFAPAKESGGGLWASWLQQHQQEWPPTSRWIAEQILRTKDFAESFQKRLKARGYTVGNNDRLVLPDGSVDERFIEVMADYIDQQNKEYRRPRGTRVLQEADETLDGQEFTAFLERWHDRVETWLERNRITTGDSMDGYANVQPLQKGMLKDGRVVGRAFDPPKRVIIAYPNDKRVEAVIERWVGPVRIGNADRDFVLIAFCPGPTEGTHEGVLLEPRAVVVGVEDQQVYYEPRSYFPLLEGRWKAWLRAHPEWPAGQAPNRAPQIIGGGYSAALEQLHETALFFERTKPLHEGPIFGGRQQMRDSGFPKHEAEEALANASHQVVMRGFDQADPYFWCASMSESLEALAPGMPSWTLTGDQLQTYSGFLLFERPVAMPRRDGKQEDLVSLLWTTRQDAAGVTLAFFTQTKTRAAGEIFGVCRWPYGYTTEQVIETMTLDAQATASEEYEPPNATWLAYMEAALRYFAAAIVFMGQKLIVTRQERAQSAFRKRVAARYPSEPPQVRIVELRRRHVTTVREDDHEPTQVNWTKRWWVSQFWRNQYYPSLGAVGDPQAYRPILIEPYIKGPEGLPLVKPARPLWVVKR